MEYFLNNSAGEMRSPCPPIGGHGTADHHFDLAKIDFRSKLRPHSTPATLSWLERNYELSEGVCIPR